MPNIFSRRSLLRACVAALPLSLMSIAPYPAYAQTRLQALKDAGAKSRALLAPASPAALASLAQQLNALETSAHGRLGLALLDSQGRPLVTHRAEERFPLCSTSKIFMVAAVLQRCNSNPALLQQRIPIRQHDIVPYSPITAPQVGASMPLGEVCAAALQHSDNSAANLLMRQVGGPEGITAFARAMGDSIFRLDRWEPELNTSLPHDPRDTSSPLAMARSLHTLAWGRQGTANATGRKNVLGPAQQQRLCMWLLGNTTGASRIAAGLPTDWQVGDKTGSGDYGTTNDVALLWLPSHKAGQAQQTYTLAVYFTQQEVQAPMRSDIVAQAARLACGG